MTRAPTPTWAIRYAVATSLGMQSKHEGPLSREVARRLFDSLRGDPEVPAAVLILGGVVVDSFG